METLALIVLALYAYKSLPGTSAYKVPRTVQDIEWQRPGIYVQLVLEVLLIVLCLVVLF